MSDELPSHVPKDMADTDAMNAVTAVDQDEIVTLVPGQKPSFITPRRLGLAGTALAVILGVPAIALVNNAHASGPAPTETPTATSAAGTPGDGTPLPSFGGGNPAAGTKDIPIQKGQCLDLSVSGDQAIIYQGDGTVNGQQTFDTGPQSAMTAAESVMQDGDYTICATQGNGDIQVTPNEVATEFELGQDSLGASRRDGRLPYVLYYTQGNLKNTVPNS